MPVSTQPGRRCVFMDRDGVINENAKPGEYILRWDQFELIPSSVDWIRLFNALDFLVIVVTNQRGVALGQMTTGDLEQIHDNMRRTLESSGAHIDDVFSCTHDEHSCECRKPKPGLVLQAARKWNISIDRSLMVGDSRADLDLARSCGLRFLRVAHGRIASDVS